MIKRYKHLQVWMESHEQGDWVKYEDHKKDKTDDIADIVERLKQDKKLCNVYDGTVHHCLDHIIKDYGGE